MKLFAMDGASIKASGKLKMALNVVLLNTG